MKGPHVVSLHCLLLITSALSTGDFFEHAQWIGGGTLLQRRLSNTSTTPVVNATIFASGVGCFSIKLDGTHISNSFMDPSWATLPTERVSYRAYDVTSFYTTTTPKLLRVSLGMCKYGYQQSFCTGASPLTDVCKGFLMLLKIQFNDGTTQTITSSSTDGFWQATTSGNPIRYSHLYHGEQYDGRVLNSTESVLWHPATPAAFNTGDTRLHQPVPASQALGQPVLLTMPPLTVSKKYSPVSITKVSSSATIASTANTNVWVFDMSTNMAGFATLSVSRSLALVPNQPLVLKYGEVLNKDGTVHMAYCTDKGVPRSGSDCRCTGINCANQTDTFYPAPAKTTKFIDDVVTYTPSFTYHGFRYIQIEGFAPQYTPSAKDITALFVHSAVRQTGSVNFPTSPVLNQIQSAIVQTQLSNLHFHPTDCPQREKRGWTGDAQFTSRQANLNFDMTELYRNWLQTMANHDAAGCALPKDKGIPTFPQTNKDICCDPKHPSFGCDYTGIPNKTFTNTKGSVADVIPFMHVGGWPGDPSWGTVSAVLPYTTWKSGGDASLVSSFYPLARSNVDFLLREGGDGVLIEFGYYGDWLSLENIPKPQVTATAQLMATSHVVEMAEYLHLQKDVQYYNQTLRTLKQLYHAKYWNESLKSYGHQQVANLMPLVLNIPPTGLAQKQTADAFVASILAAGNATKSGLVGSSFVLQALLQVQRGDIALAMATRETFPSWGYMINQGPGTIWETWDDSSNSHNHPMFTASIGPYLFAIVGLDPTTWHIPLFLEKKQKNEQKQTKKDSSTITMQLTPEVHAVRALGRAGGWVETQCGVVSLDWTLHEGDDALAPFFEMNVSLPLNCGRARLDLHAPHEASAPLCVNGWSVGDASGTTSQRRREEEMFAMEKMNMFSIEYSRSAAGKSNVVEVVVGGGSNQQFKLERCATQ